MKILYCTNFYSGASGGVKVYIHSVGEELLRKGFPFRLVVPGKDNRIEEAPDADSRVYTLASPRFPVNRDYRMIFPTDFLPWFRNRLGDIVRIEQPDVVEVSDLWTLIYLARTLKHRPGWYGLRKRPLVAGFSHDRLSDYMIHYFKPGIRQKTMLGFSSWYVRNIYLSCFDLLLANSEYTAAELRQYRDSSADRSHPAISVVPLGVDTRTFHPSRRDETFRTDFLPGGDGLLLLYAGRLAKEKGLDRLVQAMKIFRGKENRPVRLLMVGDGSRRSRIEEAALENITCLGHVTDRSHLARIYASSDVFITPSVREGFGIAQLEAMASGLPVICPDVAGQMGFMGDEAGLVTGGSASELSDAIVRMSGLPVGERTRMGRAARRIAKQFSWERTTGTILRIYREALEQQRGKEMYEAREPALARSAGDGLEGREVRP